MEINIIGIKCDNLECGWNDMSVKFEDLGAWLNKNCPCCGENLLTSDSYLQTLSLKDFESVMNHMISPFERDFHIENMHFRYKDGEFHFKTEESKTFFTTLIQEEINRQTSNFYEN